MEYLMKKNDKINGLYVMLLFHISKNEYDIKFYQEKFLYSQ